MGKGPAVIILIERWKCRQKKWLEIIAVLKADTAGSIGLNHYSPHFWEALPSSPGAYRPWIPLELGDCLLRYLRKLSSLPQPPGQIRSSLLLLQGCAYRSREGRRGVQVSTMAVYKLPRVTHVYWRGNLIFQKFPLWHTKHWMLPNPEVIAWHGALGRVLDKSYLSPVQCSLSYFYSWSPKLP